MMNINSSTSMETVEDGASSNVILKKPVENSMPSSPSRQPGCQPPASLLLEARRRRSCRPQITGNEVNDETTLGSVGSQRVGGDIGRRHSVSFLPSVAAQRRRNMHIKVVDRRSPSLDSEDSSPERQKLQRTPTPYYEDPPSSLDDMDPFECSNGATARNRVEPTVNDDVSDEMERKVNAAIRQTSCDINRYDVGNMSVVSESIRRDSSIANDDCEVSDDCL